MISAKRNRRSARSWMFVPGHSQRFLEKSRAVGADCLLLDLEDGVPSGWKETARERIAAEVQGGSVGPARFVRLASPKASQWGADLDAVVWHGLAGICLPKTETPVQVRKLAESLAVFESRRGLEAGSVGILPAIESAAALIRAVEIAGASDRVVGLMLGAEDLAWDLGLPAAREAEALDLVYPRAYLAVACAARDVQAVDGVFPDLSDDDGLERDIGLARRLGMSGKATFNPRQVEAINAGFGLSAGEVARAEAMVKAFEAAVSRGEGSVSVDGRLVDLPIVERARRDLRLAREHSRAAERRV